MPMRVAFTRWIGSSVHVPMMLVMNVGVRVLKRFVDMLVLMPLSKVKPHPKPH